MQYIKFVIIILFIIGAIFGVARYIRRLKKDYLRRIIEKNLLDKRKKLPTNLSYNSEIILLTAAWAARLPKTSLERFLRYLRQADATQVLSFLTKNSQKELAAALKSLLGMNRKDIFYKNKKALLAAALIAEAKENLSEGDLLSASEKASKAAKIFNKLNYVYEEAECYLFMGTLYRVCGVFDAADFMLRTAKKIFEHLGAPNKNAEAAATLGMLMTTQKRFGDAQKYYAESIDIYKSADALVGVAEAANQQALTYLIAGNTEQARKFAQNALRQHNKLANIQGQAFSLDIIAYCERVWEDWQAVIKTTRKAVKLHLQAGNVPARLDMLFLQAEALFAGQEFTKAEKILRQLIAEDKQCPSCFQVANSYNLLGLIYLVQHDLKRARTLFEQSMNCEIKNDRSLGLLIDYANLANVENKIGNSEQALKYMQSAIDYARALEEKELLKILEKRLSRIQDAKKPKETLFPVERQD